MNRKFYVAALATLAMAACSSEEDLQPVKTAKTSPIVFNVSFGDGVEADTRASFGGTNGYTLTWKAEHADRLSLFHGMTDPVLTAGGTETASYDAQNNAVYTAETTGDEGVKFVTQSMVKRGMAVMVYPVDTTFAYTADNKLYLSVPVTQTDETNKLIPFMSEGIEIDAYNGNKGDGAGYGKEYDIALKQVGTQLTLKANWDNLGPIKALSDAGTIEPINVTSVTLNRPTDNFNTKLEVLLDYHTPYYATAGRDAWKYQTKVNYNTPAAQNATIVSEDIDGLVTSEFTLMPQAATATPAADATIEVMTRYGLITLTETSGNVVYKQVEAPDVPVKRTVSAGLEEIITVTRYVKDNSSSKFHNEMVAGHATRWMDVDLATLDMSKAHVKNDKHLQDMILVHDALQPRNNVTFTIDGTAGVFTMSTKTVAMLNAHSEIKIKPCSTIGEACNEILLTGATEVPAMNWITGKAVVLTLADEETAWTWTGGAREMYGCKEIVNEGILDLGEGAVVKATYGASPLKTITNNGTINVVAGVNKQMNPLTNYGTINIAQGAEYRADDTAAIITNEATSATVSGKVYNSGIFATTNGGTINNYGYIENMIGGTANMTYVTSNELGTADFGSAWSATNKFGTIMLKNADDNISVSNNTAVGFIKYVYEGETYETPEVCKYNYIIVNNHDLTIPQDADHQEIKFLEVNGTTTIPVITQTNNKMTKLRGFILKGKANVKENNKLIVPAAYIKGTFYYGGLFCKPSAPGTLPTIAGTYFGNSDADCLVKY